jgi:hypothetical protein
LAELAAAQRELAEQYHARWDARTTDPSVRPDGTLPVEVLFFAYPVAAPSADTASHSANRADVGNGTDDGTDDGMGVTETSDGGAR